MANGALNKSLILLSGGLDSAVLTAYAIRRSESVQPIAGLFFKYGQRNYGPEIAAVRLLAHHYQLRIISIDIANIMEGMILTAAKLKAPIPSGMLDTVTNLDHSKMPASGSRAYVPARNTIFASIATAYAESMGCNRIWFGFIGDNPVVLDTTVDYVRAWNECSKYMTEEARRGNPIMMEAPLMNLRKSGVISLGRELEAPLHLTWSCFSPIFVNPPNVGFSLSDYLACGVCAACKQRLQGFKEVGSADTVNYAREAAVNG